MNHLDRITHDSQFMGGKACIPGIRLTVSMLLNQVAAGHTTEELLAESPYLEREHIFAALQCGAWLASEREISSSVASRIQTSLAFNLWHSSDPRHTSLKRESCLSSVS